MSDAPDPPMDGQLELPPKKDVALALLEGPSVFVHLDPRRDNVAVPKWFKKQPQLVLQIGFNMAVAIPDLDIGDEGIGCTLSFNRTQHWCFMPWPAVYALIGEDGRAMIWPDDVPAELATQMQRPKLAAVPSKKSKKKQKLAAAAEPTPEAEALRDAPAVDVEDDGGAKKKLPSYLRVIK